MNTTFEEYASSSPGSTPIKRSRSKRVGSVKSQNNVGINAVIRQKQTQNMENQAKRSFSGYVQYVIYVKTNPGVYRNTRVISEKNGEKKFKSELSRVETIEDADDLEQHVLRLKNYEAQAEDFLTDLRKKKREIVKNRDKNLYESFKAQIDVGMYDPESISKIKNEPIKMKVRAYAKQKEIERKKEMYKLSNDVIKSQEEYFKNTGDFRNKKYFEKRFNFKLSPNVQKNLNMRKKRLLIDFFSEYKKTRVAFLKGYVTYLKRFIRSGKANNSYIKNYKNSMNSITKTYGSSFLRKYTREAAKRMSTTENMYRKSIRSLIILLRKKYRRYK